MELSQKAKDFILDTYEYLIKNGMEIWVRQNALQYISIFNDNDIDKLSNLYKELGHDSTPDLADQYGQGIGI